MSDTEHNPHAELFPVTREGIDGIDIIGPTHPDLLDDDSSAALLERIASEHAERFPLPDADPGQPIIVDVDGYHE